MALGPQDIGALTVEWRNIHYSLRLTEGFTGVGMLGRYGLDKHISKCNGVETADTAFECALIIVHFSFLGHSATWLHRQASQVQQQYIAVLQSRLVRRRRFPIIETYYFFIF